MYNFNNFIDRRLYVNAIDLAGEANQRLYEAVRNGDLAGVQQAFEAGADPNTKRIPYISIPDRMSLFHLALYLSPRLPIVQEFIRRGAFPNITDAKGKTPLHYAVEARSLPIVQELLREEYINPSIADVYGRTPLHYAAMAAARSFPIAQALLMRHAHPSTTDVYGKTPLHLAVEAGSLPIVQALIGHGVGFDIPDLKGKTPLHYAAMAAARKCFIANYLVGNVGANSNIPDLRGKTPLHYAAAAGDLPMVRSLINDGEADPNIIDAMGKTPLHYAIQNRRQDIIEFLHPLTRRDIIHPPNKRRVKARR